ncbi:MAG: hypothetical protein JSW34_00455 [Candidatus Zixiibacteriota bacterium]|nr:MAG: hypothetical protein JSW34_00455 [candidate division Zixibacteria bacterium]
MAALGTVLFYYFWMNQQKLVLFLIIYTPFEELVLKWLPDSLYAPTRYMWESMLFAIMGLMLVERMLLSRTWKSSPIDRLMLLFVFGWFLSGLVNHIPLTTSLIHIKNLVRYVPLFYIIYNLKPDRALLRRIVTAVIAIGVLQSLVCIGQALEGNILIEMFRPRDIVVGGQLIGEPGLQHGSYHTKFTGMLPRSGDLGNYLAFAGCFVVSAYLLTGKKRRYLAALVPILTGLALSSSRISWVSAFFGAAVMLFTLRHRWRWLYIAVPGITALLIIAGVLTPATDSVNQDFNMAGRFFHLFTSDYIEAISATGRLCVLLYTVPAVLSATPLLGMGPGTFVHISMSIPASEVYAKADALGLQEGAVRWVHDVGYAALLIQGGLLCLIALLWIFGRLYRRARNVLRHSEDPWLRTFGLASLGLLAMMAIQNLACFNITYRNQSVIIWTVCGLIALWSSVLQGRNERDEHDRHEI